MDDSSHPPSRESVLDYLSFQAPNNNNQSIPAPSRRRQGVLWKRRDLFKNHWRPRFFVLHQEQHLLTYYLLTNINQITTDSSQQASSSPVDQSRASFYSSSSDITDVDYDVVPRGSIYLLGSSVEANQLLTNPSENLYVFTITDHQNLTHVHLAARTVQSRDEWIRHITMVCDDTPTPPQPDTKTLKTILIPHLPTSIDWNDHGGMLDNRLTAEMRDKVEKILTKMNWSHPEKESNSNVLWENRLEDAMRRTGHTLPSEVAKQMEHVLTKAFVPSTNTAALNNKWTTLSIPEITDKIPSEMVETMDQLLQTYLPYIEQKDHPDLIFKHESNGIHCSFHKTKNLIRSIRNIQDHTAVDYLKLLWVFERDLELESNVTLQEPLHQYNVNTSLVYKAYQAVWPTGPREFCSAAHWRLLKNESNGKMALCLLAFSCPQADSYRPNVAPKHIRGHLDVSLQIWEQTPEGCIHTRILSYDLKGNIPNAILQTALTQQANLPRIMDAHLTKVKKRSHSTKDMTELDYGALYKVLSKRQDEAKNNNEKAKADLESDSIVDLSSSLSTITQSRSTGPSVLVESMVLLGPVLLYHLLQQSPFTLLCVIPTMVMAIRWVFLEHLLQFSIQLPHQMNEREAASTVRCQFTIDLKGIESFRKQQQKDKKTDVVTIHVVLRALARAMAKNQSLFARQLFLLPPVYNSSIIMYQNSNYSDKRSFASKEIWIRPSCQQSIDELSKYLSSDDDTYEPSLLETHILGPSCRLWLLPEHTTTSHPPVDIACDTMSSPLTVCVTPYREQQTRTRTTNHLNISFSFQSTKNVAACRSFTEQVQQLIQMPEMCDE